MPDCPKAPAHSVEGMADVEQLLEMLTRIPPESIASRSIVGHAPTVQSTCSPSTRPPQKSSVHGEPSAAPMVLLRTKGTTGARPGLGSWGRTMNERKPVGQQNPMEAAATRRKRLQAKPAKLGRDVQARLGHQLRAMYDEVVNQGVPDRFNELIDRLDGSGKKDAQ